METERDRTDSPSADDPNRDGFDVVIVEDNKDIINQLKIAFRHDTSVFVQVFLDPFAALAWLHAQQYSVDAIITDIAMPEKSGRQLTEEIRENEQVMRKNPTPIEIFWYTGFTLDLSEPDSEYAKTYRSANVRKVYLKGEYTAVDVIKDVVKILEEESNG